jgi:hypothetical protein
VRRGRQRQHTVFSEASTDVWHLGWLQQPESNKARVTHRWTPLTVQPDNPLLTRASDALLSEIDLKHHGLTFI